MHNMRAEEMITIFFLYAITSNVYVILLRYVKYMRLDHGAENTWRF